MNLDISNDITKDKAVDIEIQDFMNELENSMKDTKTQNILEIPEKYREFWEYRNGMEDDVAASLGLSRLLSDNFYHLSKSNPIKNQLNQLSKEEGTLYRKNSFSHEVDGETKFNVYKFENGKNKYINMSIPSEELPKGFYDKDIIFQIDDQGKVQIRQDLKYKAINGACEEMMPIKQEYDKKRLDYKKEGHLYEVYEGEGYIHLRDITDDKGAIEDIDFVVDNYKGEGIYKVINGEYTKIE